MWTLFQAEMYFNVICCELRPDTDYKPVAGIVALNPQDAYNCHNEGINVAWQSPDCRSASAGDILMSPEGKAWRINGEGFTAIEEIRGIDMLALAL